MSNFEYYKTVVLKKYATFSGRAARSEYWYFVLFNIIISIVLSMADGITGLKSDSGSGLLSGIYSLAVLVPSLAVSVRRLHDTGKTGWWALICLIPVLGWIVFLIFMVTDSTPGDNQYGPNPKGVTANVAMPAAPVPQQPENTNTTPPPAV